MHQVYDDEMTFKLVAAASSVSGLPVEVCLEEFGKHFLVYCQKNGYDQILRVLGSNLYDFLTNLDNLHDHLASIYPGMRAPSFRVTRSIYTNQKHSQSTLTSNSMNANYECAKFTAHGSDDLHKENASCSLAGSMYLHYYSERAGLSPIVKGLVMAVAKEFFQTDIQVTECKLTPSPPTPTDSSSSPELPTDDHVVLKIDRQMSANKHEPTTKILADDFVDANKHEETQPMLLEAPDNGLLDQQCLSAASEPKRTIAAEPAASGPQTTAVTAGGQSSPQVQTTNLPQQKQPIQTKSMLNVYDSLSTNAQDSLVGSEIMMQTFPFHVIFDRQFNLVQVGKSLLRATSLFWQRRANNTASQETDIFGPNPLSGSKQRQQKQKQQQQPQVQDHLSVGREFGGTATADSIEPTSGSTGGGQQMSMVKFSDLFRIVRPKIEFTYDAIADHTNQVFVVKTKPLVLDSDYRRLKRLSSSGSSSAGSATGAQSLNVQQQQQSTSTRRRPLCPMDRIASTRRSLAATRPTLDADEKRTSLDLDVGREQGLELELESSPQRGRGGSGNGTTTATIPQSADRVDSGAQMAASNGDNNAPATPTNNASSSSQQQLDELGDPVNHLSLRLKGQMIILLGGELCLFLCSPRVDHLDQLLECGVMMSDFALHDRARELMLMSHTHKEDREAVKKLDQASNDLKKMDTKLRLENKRTNEVLHNIFPAKIATLLSHGHKVESESFDLVTCLYSDIIGFTKMCGSENVRPIDIVRLLNTLYLQFDNLTNIHGVFKVETIGDAYVVVGGLPEPAEDHADRCVKMGLDMVKVIATVRSPADNQPIQMRIGIHSGPVMAGIVGIRVPRYSLFGNTTTRANQLETNGVGGKIHISDFTLKNLIKRDRFVVEDNPNEISGIPFVTYFVTNYLGDEQETQQHERILEEQLIKDFELMGNEVELVDESDSYPDQLYAPYSQQTSAATAATAVASSSTNSDLLPQGLRKRSLGAVTRRESLEEERVERSPSISVPPSTSPLSSAQTCGDVARAPAYSQSLADGGSVKTASSGHKGKSPVALGEALVNSNEEDEHDRLILMDIEDQRKEFRRMASQLCCISGQLSAAIIADALEQVAKQKRQEGADWDLGTRLLAILTRPHGSLQLVARQLSAGSEQRDICANAKPSHADSLVACPLCAGQGSLNLDGPDVVHIKLMSAPFDKQSSGLRSPAKREPEGDERGKADCVANVQIGRRLVEWLCNRLNEMNGASLGANQLDSSLGVSSAISQALTSPLASALHQPDKRSWPEKSLSSAGFANCRIQQQQIEDQLLISEGSQDELDQLRRVLSCRRRPSIEQLLLELRDERRKLQEQVDRLKTLRVSSDCESSGASSSGEPRKSSGGSGGETTRALVGATHVPRIGVGRILSNNIQRMKRMDTLKRRKMKKAEDQQQHQVGLTPRERPEEVRSLTSSPSIRSAANGRNSARVVIAEETEDADDVATTDSLAQVGQNSDTKRALNAEATSCGEQQQQQPQPQTQQQRRSSTYSYQNLRASLASLVNELGLSQPPAPSFQKRADKKKRFSLNVFQNFTLTSPFSSPVKRTHQVQENLDKQSRKQSSRSQSSGSAGANSANSPRAGKTSLASNCSCLRSSASSQSGDSMRIIKG